MRMKSLKFNKFINSVNQGSFQIINAAAGSGSVFIFDTLSSDLFLAVADFGLGL